MSEFSEILQKEIEAARRDAVKSIPSNTHQDLVIQDLTSENRTGVKETRFIQRLKQRKIAELDNLINQYFQERMLSEDPNSEAITVHLLEKYDARWRHIVTKFNRKGTKGYAPRKGVSMKDHVTPGHGNPFELLPEAFKEKVKYFIQMEKSQIAAAKRKAEEKIAEHWVKVNKHRFHKMYPVRWFFFWLFSAFMRKHYLAKWNRFYRKHIYQE